MSGVPDRTTISNIELRDDIVDSRVLVGNDPTILNKITGGVLSLDTSDQYTYSAVVTGNLKIEPTYSNTGKVYAVDFVKDGVSIDDIYLRVDGQNKQASDIVWDIIGADSSNPLPRATHGLRWSGLTDSFRIFAEHHEGTDNTRLVISAEDNGDADYVLFRNRSGATTSDIFEVRHTYVKSHKELRMSGSKITGLGAPSANTDASTKKYVDDTVSAHAGVSASASVSGHVKFDSTSPANIGATASAGTSTVPARRDHVHAHGTFGASSSDYHQIYVKKAGDTIKGNLLFADATRTIGTSTNHGLNIQTNSTTRIKILANGRVGINLSGNPTADLEVGGSVKATSFTGSFTGNLNGNASTADKWSTTRKISLTGAVASNPVDIDGSNNILISTTLANHDLVSSHTVSGLTKGHFLKALSDKTFGFSSHGLTYSDVGAAPASHGNHVPTPATGSNIKNNIFLRNDNTWQTVTPANIGAAPSGYGLGTVAATATGDWNNYKTTGFFQGSSLSNACPGSHSYRYCIVIRHNDSYVSQTMYDFSGNGVYHRTLLNGTWNDWQRLDHRFGTDTKTIGSSNSSGTSSTVARSDHVHAHGNQGGGSLHSIVTNSSAGFMSSAMKQKLDGIEDIIKSVKVNRATVADSADSVAWANVTSKPAQATRWPSWSEVTSKPSTFTPSSHSHATGDITSGTLGVARGGTGRSSLTSGKVLVGNGTSAVLMPTNLHWNNSSSRLGIGTTAPNEALHVAGKTESTQGFKTGNFEIVYDSTSKCLNFNFVG